MTRGTAPEPMGGTPGTARRPWPRSLEPVLHLLYCPQDGILDRLPHPLSEDRTVVGRATGSGHDLCLPEDEMVSRVHAVLLREGGGVRLVDQGSRNGTLVNGVRVTQVSLEDGDVIQIGQTFLLLRHCPASLPEAPIATLLGVSPAMCALRARLLRVARLRDTVLLTGETGTGKGVVAEALHRHSGRAGPFIAVNCTAVPENLIESQFFGHVAGAFTGAQAHKGFFRAAAGGTLFLDEIGELPAPVQPKLLKALEDRAVLPVGAVAPVAADVRIIAATNRDLDAAMRAGTFRRDLYERLAQLPLELPPLRRRREDILLLLAHGYGGKVPRMTRRLVEALLLHDWPGNVREVRNLAAALRNAGDGHDVLDLDLLGGRLRRPEAPPQARQTAPAPAADPRDQPTGEIAVPERRRRPVPSRDELIELLSLHRGNLSRVAQAVGRSRMQVHRWLAGHGLDPRQFREPK
jgi:DNA-binding NtrC family response regulator